MTMGKSRHLRKAVVQLVDILANDNVPIGFGTVAIKLVMQASVPTCLRYDR
jgi:hypothetical protein